MAVLPSVGPLRSPSGEPPTCPCRRRLGLRSGGSELLDVCRWSLAGGGRTTKSRTGPDAPLVAAQILPLLQRGWGDTGAPRFLTDVPLSRGGSVLDSVDRPGGRTTVFQKFVRPWLVPKFCHTEVFGLGPMSAVSGGVPHLEEQSPVTTALVTKVSAAIYVHVRPTKVQPLDASLSS